MLERWNYSTTWDYLKSFKWSWDGLATVFKIGTDPVYFTYMMRNIAYDIPYFGSRMFAKNAVTIVPTLKKGDISKDKGYGGARPQIINTKTRSIDMGEARIEGKNAIFNITPSPGASTCLANAKRDAQIVVKNLGKKFDSKKFKKELE
jgi:malate dehydrogenase (quinone)